VEVEVIASDEHVIATRSSYRGTNATDEVGAYEVTNCEVWTEAGGELASVDLYDDDERGAAIARFVELGGGLSKLGDTQPERLWREVARRFSAHDLDGLIALYAEGTAIIDHRKLAWESAHSDEDWRTRVSTFFTTSWEAIPDLRPEVGEVLAASDGAIALVIDWRGTVPFGGGEFLVSVGVVNAVESGQFVTYDQYEPESREAMLARFAELSSPGGSAA
jgi:hypothetical protein